MSEPRIKFYESTHAGMHHQSIYPALFRCRYKRMMTLGRVVEQDVIRSGRDAFDVRYRMQLADPHGNIRGPIEVEHIMDLAPVYEGSITDTLR